MLIESIAFGFISKKKLKNASMQKPIANSNKGQSLHTCNTLITSFQPSLHLILIYTLYEP